MNLTFRNATPFVAQFIVHKGDLVLTRLLGIETNAQVQVPSNDTIYQVVAQTVLEGNTYSSAPLTVTGDTGFLAQVLQVSSQGTYEFDVATIASAVPNALTFQKTCVSPVTFIISKDGVPLQQVVVADSFEQKVLNIGEVFSIYAIINGVTTATSETANPNAVITATQETSGADAGSFELAIS